MHLLHICVCVFVFARMCIMFILFKNSTGDGTQVLEHARHVLYHQVAFPAMSLLLSICPTYTPQ